MNNTLSITTVILLLLPCMARATTWHVPEDVPTIQGAIALAESGDDVLVAPGEYFEHDITLKAGVTVHTQQGPGVTIVNAEGLGRGFYGSDLGELATLEGLTIRNGRGLSGSDNGAGGGIRCESSDLVIRDCEIRECTSELHGGGLAVYDSSVEIERCRVEACYASNAAGGIFAWCESGEVRITSCEVIGNEAGGSGGGIMALADVEVAIVGTVVTGNQAIWGSSGGMACLSPTLLIQDCLVSENVNTVMGGAVLSIIDSSGMITGCTVANNSGYPYPAWGVAIETSTIDLTQTIIANNGGGALDCSGWNITVRCCDVFGNGGGDDICGTDLGGNFSEDPLFCNPENGDYTLDENSPCLPGNHPNGEECGLIGARDVGCGAVSVEKTTWGRLKASFR